MNKKSWNAQKLAPYLFVAPFIISFCLFSIYPLVSTFLMSFQKIYSFDEVYWVSLDNFRRLFRDQEFYAALWNVARYVFWTLVILIPVPMLLSYLINSKLTPFKDFFKTLYFLPVLTSGVIAGLVFRFAFSSEASGAFNRGLSHVGIGPISWLERPHTAMIALVVIAVWRWLGVNIIYFLSGLQGISKDLYESAEVDGANAWKKFVYITVPMLKPITIYVLTISIMGGFSLFNEAFVYWGVTSPNNIGATLVTLIYKAAFGLGDFGYAAALGVTLFLMVVIVNTVQAKLMGLFKED